MLLYIHGFRTTPTSHKATLLKAEYQERLIVSDHSCVPRQAIGELEEIIENNPITGIIASSIGGFYATYLSEKYQLKAMLINPSVAPYETTRKYLGANEKFDGTTFHWTEEHLEMLAQLRVTQLTPENYFVFLQKGDAVLDYRKAEAFYAGAKFVIEEGGNHRFHKFERFFGEIALFLEG